MTASTHRSKRFLEQLQPLFVQILEYACGLGIFKLGDISIDGTKIQANGSKHKAMSWEYACQLEVQLKAEVEALLHKAQTEPGETFRDIDIPQEIQRRQERRRQNWGAQSRAVQACPSKIRAGASRVRSQNERAQRQRRGAGS